jgi:hypothetical protein
MAAMNNALPIELCDVIACRRCNHLLKSSISTVERNSKQIPSTHPRLTVSRLGHFASLSVDGRILAGHNGI